MCTLGSTLCATRSMNGMRPLRVPSCLHTNGDSSLDLAISASSITTGPSSTAPPCSFPTSGRTKRSLATTYTITKLSPDFPWRWATTTYASVLLVYQNQLYKYSYHIPINPTSEIGFRHHHSFVRTHHKFDMSAPRCIYLSYRDSTEHRASHRSALGKDRISFARNTCVLPQ